MVLEEEGVEYRSRAVDIGGQMEHLEPWYIRVNKSAVVPTLIYKVSYWWPDFEIQLFIA